MGHDYKRSICRGFLTLVAVLIGAGSASADMDPGVFAQVYWGGSDSVQVVGETLPTPTLSLTDEALILDVSELDEFDRVGTGVFFEANEAFPYEVKASVTMDDSASLEVTFEQSDSMLTLAGITMADFDASYVTLLGDSSILVDAKGGTALSAGVALNEIHGVKTAALVLDEASIISSKATARSDSAYADSYGVAMDDDVHDMVSLDGGSSITAESLAVAETVAGAAAEFGDSSSAEAGAYGVSAGYSDLIEVALAGGSTVTAKASAVLDVDVEEVDGYTGATAVGVQAYGEIVNVSLSEASKVDVEAVAVDEAEAVGIMVSYQDDSFEELSVNHGEVILADASSVAVKAVATGSEGVADATGVEISAEGLNTAILKMSNGSTVTAEASSTDDSNDANAYGVNIYSSPNVDVDLLSGSSIEAKSTMTAGTGYLVGLNVEKADTVNILFDEGSFIKATGLASEDASYVDPTALAVSDVTDLTLRLQNGSQVIAQHIADGTDPYPYAYGLSIADVDEADISLASGSAIIVSSTALGESAEDDSASCWGVSAGGRMEPAGVVTITLDESLILATATSNGTDVNDAYAYGVTVYDVEEFSASLGNGSQIVATASTTGTGEAISCGVFLDSVDSAEINIDDTSSISGTWAVMDGKKTTALNNDGTLAGRVVVSVLNNSETGVLQAAFGQNDTELSQDGIRYFESVALGEGEVQYDSFYFSADSAQLADGTTFRIVSPDDLGLVAPGDSAVYALLDSPSSSWNQDQLNITSASQSSLLDMSWDESSDAEKLNIKFTFLTPDEAGLSQGATGAVAAAEEAGIFTFGSDPEEWTPNVSGAFVAGMTQSIGTSYFNIGNRLGALMGMNSGDEVVASNGMWFSARFTEAEQDKRDNVTGFDSDTTGLSIGIDREFGDTVLGFAYTRGSTDADANDNSADFDMTDNLFSLYGSYDGGAWYSEAILSAGFGSVDGERRVGSDVYESDYDSDSYNAKVEMGVKLNQQGWQINPLFALQYSAKEYDSYTETGSGDMALSVKSEDYSTFTAGIGAAIEKEFLRNWGSFTPEVRAMVNYDIENDRIVSTANFVGGNTSFVAKGIEPSETSWDLGAALTVASLGEQNVSFRVGYDYSGREDFEAHSFTGKIRFEF